MPTQNLKISGEINISIQKGNTDHAAKIINRQGQITEIASDNENFNFFYNPINGQGNNV